MSREVSVGTLPRGHREGDMSRGRTKQGLHGEGRERLWVVTEKGAHQVIVVHDNSCDSALGVWQVGQGQGQAPS